VLLPLLLTLLLFFCSTDLAEGTIKQLETHSESNFKERDERFKERITHSPLVFFAPLILAEDAIKQLKTRSESYFEERDERFKERRERKG